MAYQNAAVDMEEVYNEYFSPIYNYVFYRLLNRENTEDIVSQVFMKVCAHLPACPTAEQACFTAMDFASSSDIISFK